MPSHKTHKTCSAKFSQQQTGALLTVRKERLLTGARFPPVGICSGRGGSGCPEEAGRGCSPIFSLPGIVSQVSAEITSFSCSSRTIFSQGSLSLKNCQPSKLYSCSLGVVFKNELNELLTAASSPSLCSPTLHSKFRLRLLAQREML